jgi:hypothetical protein
MARGGTSFFTGAIVVQLPEALDAFVRASQPGNEFVYCEAPAPQYGETWSKAGELARQGLVRTHERRRAGGGRQYYLVRTTKALPRELGPQDKVLADRATAAMFAELKRAASLGLPCPSDAELARKAGLNTRPQAMWRMRELIRVELISSTLAYEGGVPSRVVTIAPGRHAGSAAGKFTALPKKWRALREADDAHMDRLRRAGL